MAEEEAVFVDDPTVDFTQQQRLVLKELMRKAATLAKDQIELERWVGETLTLVIVATQLLVGLASSVNIYLEATFACASLISVVIASLFIYLSGFVVISFWAYWRIGRINFPLLYLRILQAELKGEIIQFETANRVLGDRIIRTEADPTEPNRFRPFSRKLNSPYVDSIKSMKSAISPHRMFSTWCYVGFMFLFLIHLAVLGIVVPSMAHGRFKKKIIGGMLGFATT